MTDWIKRLAVAAVVIVIVATLINDIGTYLTSYYRLDNVTRGAASAAASVIKHDPTAATASGLAAMAYAKENDVTVYGFDQSNGRCTVWTRADVIGTWVWGPASAVLAGKPYSQWRSAPLQITGKAEALVY